MNKKQYKAIDLIRDRLCDMPGVQMSSSGDVYDDVFSDIIIDLYSSRVIDNRRRYGYPKRLFVDYDHYHRLDLRAIRQNIKDLIEYYMPSVNIDQIQSPKKVYYVNEVKQRVYCYDVPSITITLDLRSI
jgi:hypothetical protein